MLMPKSPDNIPADIEANGTAEKILLSAVELFASHGFHGVSLRAINDHAGAKNGSAIQYHFGGKQGLIEAVVEFVAQRMFPEATAQLQRYVDGLVDGHVPTVREVVEAMFGPALKYTLHGEHGMAAAKIFPLVIQDADPDVRRLFIHAIDDVRILAEQLLRHVLPQKPAGVVRLHLGFAVINLVHLVSGLHVFYGANETITDEDVLVGVYDQFIDYAASGLASSKLSDGSFRAMLRSA